MKELRIDGIPDVSAVAAQLNLEVKDVQAEGFEGALLRAKEMPVGAIAISSSIRELGRRNFTIAHEVGHFLIPGHDQGESVCTSLDIGNWRDTSKQRERDADEFAAELLMPRIHVQPVAKAEPPSIQLISKIANLCNASLSASAWRFCDLVSERCAIVWSSNRTVQWSRSSEEFRFGIRRGMQIEKGTFAFECHSGRQPPNQPAPVKAHLWIQSQNVIEGSEIWEQSVTLPAYSSVLSLLWIKDRIEKYSDQDEEELLEELDGEHFNARRRHSTR
jgi:hypothetical protein